MVSDWRSSRSATAPIRRELTSRKAFDREMNGSVFLRTQNQPKVFCGVQRFRTMVN